MWKLFSRLTNATPLKDDFAKAVVGEVSRVSGSKEAVYNAAEFRVSFRGNQLSLESPYKAYCESPEESRGSLVQRVAGMLLQDVTMPGAWDVAAERVLPKVISRVTFQAMVAAAGSLPSRPIGRDLVATLVLDSPEQMLFVSTEQLENWSVDPDVAFAAANSNLQPALVTQFAQVMPGLYVIESGDLHAAARLLYPQLFQDLAINGQIIALPVDRQTLVVTGSQDVHNLEVMFGQATAMLENSYLCMATPLVLNQGEWSSTVDLGGAASRRFAETIKALQYREQKSLMDRLHLVQNRAVHVANAQLMAAPDASLLSFTICPLDVVTWAPKMEQLWLGRQIGEEVEFRKLPWKQAVEALQLNLVEDVWPERVQVHVPWSPELWAKLAALSLED